MKVVGIVGKRNAGKTTLVLRLIEEFHRRNLRVGCVKHDYHASFDWDIRGKDTWKMSEAGAEATALMSPGKYALKFRTQEEEEDVLKMVGRHLREMDVVLIEGFTWVEMPKVEVFREGISEKIMTDKQQRIALYGDSSEESESGFYSWSDLSGLADCILASVPDFPV